MNKRQKTVQEAFLNNEEVIIKRLKQVYNQSLKDITKKSEELQNSINSLTMATLSGEMDDQEKEQIQSMIQSRVYQKQYQDALKKQISSILDNMQVEEFKTVSEYLNKSYEEGFLGTVYDLHGQGIPLIMPIDQEAMVRAVQLDSKISNGLYSRLGEDVALLKKKITAQVSRGISTGMTSQQIAKQLASYTNIGFNNAVRIARTEGHRIQVQSGMDACYKAKDKGADVVKQWDAALDARTRESHARVDGEIRELDEPFSNGLMYPGDPSGGASEVVNCRCALLQRARWALDEDELNTLKERASYFGIDKNDSFEDYKKKYLRVAQGNELKQTAKITEKNHVSGYGAVDRKLVNSKTFHDKYENLTTRKVVNESMYQESMKILEHRDGTAFEDVVMIDARTGNVLESVVDCDEFGKVKITNEQYERITKYSGQLILLHNHPNSSRPSYTDIVKLKEKTVEAVVAVGHDGSVYKVYNLDKYFDIEKFYNKAYNLFKEKYSDDVLAQHYATDALYASGKFQTESR